MCRLVARAALLVAPLALACRPAAGPPAQRAGSELSPAELRRDLTVFAADSLGGRATGTPYADKAVAFLTTRLAALGLEPAGDSGFVQRVPLVRGGYGEGTRFSVTTSSGTQTLALGADLVPLPALARDEPLPRLQAEGELVFVGYGPGRGSSSLAGLDLAGKVVVVVNGAPASTDSARRAALETERAIGPRLRELIPRRPAAIIVLATGRSVNFVEDLGERLRRPRQTSISLGVPDSLRTLPMILLGTVQPGSPLLPAGWPRDARPQPLEGRRFRAVVDDGFTGYNVVAIVRGADPARRGTYVAYGAHYDHLGIEPPVNGDSIANGADDDGTGSVALLAIAGRFAQGPRPARSLLFVWHVGEEEGLLGSDWFTSHPTVPIDSIVGQLNADMIGRNDPDSVYLVGPNAAPNGQSRVIGAVVDSVNGTLPRPFSINRDWDSPTHPEQLYYRSDHFNYARRGVPVVFFTTGMHADYHTVGDEVEKIDFDKMSRVADLLYRVGLALADRPTRPR